MSHTGLLNFVFMKADCFTPLPVCPQHLAQDMARDKYSENASSSEEEGAGTCAHGSSVGTLRPPRLSRLTLGPPGFSWPPGLPSATAQIIGVVLARVTSMYVSVRALSVVMLGNESPWLTFPTHEPAPPLGTRVGFGSASRVSRCGSRGHPGPGPLLAES